MPLIEIDGLSDPRLAPYANMRDAELAQRQDPLDAAAHGGLFIAEGELVVERLINSCFPTESVLLTPTRLGAMRPVLDRLPETTPIYLAAPPVMNQIVGFNMHRGVLAIGRRTNPWSIPDLVRRGGPLLILENLTNHDNLGGIFRNAAGLGGPGCAILLSPRCADPLYRKSLRVSMGHILGVPFARLTDLAADLSALAAAGWILAALTPAAEALDLDTAAQTLHSQRVALILGAEGPGLSDAALTAAHCRIQIPMRPVPAGSGLDPNTLHIDSLNVAMAAGIALYRFGRA